MTERDELVISIEWPGEQVEVAFHPDEDADFIAFFTALTYEEQAMYIRAALTLAMLRDVVKERLAKQ